jgi:predicted secreted protein
VDEPAQIPPDPRQQRAAVRTAIIAALVALGFYVGFFLYMHWTRK